eukprot:12894900-Prorocentrum_lima.AAC.1
MSKPLPSCLPLRALRGLSSSGSPGRQESSLPSLRLQRLGQEQGGPQFLTIGCVEGDLEPAALPLLTFKEGGTVDSHAQW